MKRRLALLCFALAALVLLVFVPTIEADAAERCRPQKAQSFLIRKSYIVKGQMQPKRHERAVRYRTEHYGLVEGFGNPKWNSHAPSTFAETTTFMGLSLSVHQKIVPALSCVEREIKKSCGKDPYEARAVSGFRDRNTYRGGEITNHLFGIALDIDPERNPCCHCVEPWSQDPQCQKDVKSPYERAAMPRCWIQSFEKYGFYWLGHDELEDTMHFEFLGRPEKVVKLALVRGDWRAREPRTRDDADAQAADARPPLPRHHGAPRRCRVQRARGAAPEDAGRGPRAQAAPEAEERADRTAPDRRLQRRRHL